jgi:hypothetical protein
VKICVVPILVAGLLVGATEPRVSSKALEAVEGMVNSKFGRGLGADPFDLLGTAHCTYLDGFGAAITLELQLVYVSGPTPFRLTYSPQEIAALHERKLKKLPVLKDAMRSILAGSATTLDSVPPNQRIAMDAKIWHYSWEDSKGIPQRILMFAEKSKLLEAQGSPTALAAVIEEQVQ